MRLEDIYEEQPPEFYETRTHAEGPSGKLPLTEDFLRNAPSGYIFSMTQGRGMGWEADDLANDDIMMISTLGGLRDADGNPTALGLHTGHFELGMLLDEAAKEFKRLDHIPYATFVSDPCDGRSQGTTGMFDSLPYRNDAAMVFRRQIRSLPTRTAVLGVASCDKGLPALMMALVSQHDTPTILVPGGATLKAYDHEDLGTVQTVGIRFAAGEMTLEEAMIEGCRACASGGGGCQFLGTAATSQVVGEALGLALPHSALCPSGEDIWKNLGTASARALLGLKRDGITTRDVITDKSIENAMVLHAAFGGSTNLLLHLTAIAYEAGCKVPTVDDWERINKKVPRLVSVMPIGPVHFPTGVAYLAGGVPETMLHLRDLGLLHLDALTVTGKTVGENLEWWENSDRRARVQERLLRVNKIPKDDVIMDPEKAHRNGLTSTVTFPKGNIAPEGSVVKSTAIDPSVVGEDGVFRQTGPARIFVHEKDAMAALKDGKIQAGDVMVIAGIGPSGTGMEETYQLTSALKKLPYGKHVSLITDARFSGVSTGACFGHVGPEALAGGPIGKLQEGDLIEIVVDTVNLEGSLNFIGRPGEEVSWEEGATVLAERPSNPDLAPDEDLPDDTRLWAALQDASGGIWRGCVYDVDRIVETLQAGRAALKEAEVAWAQ
ncbi:MULTISPECIES: YjhG/YagF family D-xylonate dehydratase [Actinotignum]|uniref:YjhG/YagF family D-xylonate dehydratase n=2 Tax=Actinotignum TaxID=1653174 RepID=A0AAW9HM86_9ACTO|nr:YjhG/YagF family D-xylonate dehydratase [Actinotignum timonense]MDY5129973.1 YjhG/YagF family D-xylonate dehydratase [Actinotignum timonense]MDY5140521.1 YjhG/YagF family D-xylonate dehydratase [Actinotignum timonense]